MPIFPTNFIGNNVHEILLPPSGYNKYASLLLLSDIHIDNPLCDRSQLIDRLDEAKERGAGVMMFGDIFCAMQGRYDPRGSKSSLRPEHNVANYFDALVETTYDVLKPYKDNILFISPGNHETSILKRQETDLIQRLAQLLGCAAGSYTGWVLLKVRRYDDGHAQVVPLHYHHGYGGGGPVTKDVIQTSRKAVYLPDAQIVVSGHTHDRWVVPISRERINKQTGTRKIDEQWHVKLGTFKDEYSNGNGWAVERGMPPKARGGVWLNLATKQEKNKSKKIYVDINLQMA
jgi:hypothetical protein